MKVKFRINDSTDIIDTETKRIEIQIGENTYLLSESIEGKLNINKSDGDDGSISVHPRYTNVIEVL